MATSIATPRAIFGIETFASAPPTPGASGTTPAGSRVVAVEGIDGAEGVDGERAGPAVPAENPIHTVVDRQIG